MASFEQFQQVELEYDVKSIKVKGIEMWPVLRIYFASEYVIERNTEVQLSVSKILPLIISFFYGFCQIFKKTDYLFLSAADQRKKCGDKYIDRADILAEMVENTLIMELPLVTRHYPKSKLINQRLCSKIPFFLLVKSCAFIMPLPKIEEELTIVKVLEKLDLNKDYKGIIKRFLAERLITRMLIKWKKLKGLFLITSYTNIGVVYAFKEMKKPVVEFQHGMIVKSHLAYNINQKFEINFYPDYLLTFGEKEKDVFNSTNNFIDNKRVFPVGSFIVDYIIENGVSDLRFSKEISQYKSVMAFAAQDWFEEQYIPFLKKLASDTPDLGIILIPRNRKTNHFKKFNLPSNIIFAPWLSTYDIIYLSDFHSTIYSTTTYEATAMGKPTILMNINNLSHIHLGNDFPVGNKAVIIADDVLHFKKALMELENREFNIEGFNQKNIKLGFKKNLFDFLRTELPEHLA